MSKINGPAPNPCQSCPYRRDVPSGVWSAEDYEKLPMYDHSTGDQPLRMFQCHQNGPSDDKARLCAGWVGCHGSELLSLRIGIVSGRMDPDVMDYSTKVPLFTSGTEAAEHGMRDIESPGEEALILGEKIARSRADIREECY